MLPAVNGPSANPPEIPVEPAAPPALPLTEINAAKRRWTLTLHPRHLALCDPTGAQPYTIPYEEVMTSTTLLEGMRTLALTKPVKLNFKLPPETQAALVLWIGKPALARAYLKRRYSWILPFAIVWVLTSIPMAGDPASGHEPLPFDPFGLILGITLIAMWAWAKWRPHPLLFLIDSFWFLAVAVQLALQVAHGRSKFWLLWMLLLLWLVLTGFKHFIRFKGIRLSAKE
jgi:hypothetical protein